MGVEGSAWLTVNLHRWPEEAQQDGGKEDRCQAP